MKKKCCLSFGKCNKKFWALIVSALIIDVVFIILIIYFFYSAHNIDINFLMDVAIFIYGKSMPIFHDNSSLNI